MKFVLSLLLSFILSCDEAKFSSDYSDPTAPEGSKKKKLNSSTDDDNPVDEQQIVTETDVTTAAQVQTTTTLATDPCFSGSATKIAAATISVNQATGVASYEQKTGTFNGSFIATADNKGVDITFSDNEKILMLMNATCLRTALNVVLSPQDDSVALGGFAVDVSIDAAAGNDRIETLNVGNFGGKVVRLRGGAGSDQFVTGGMPGASPNSTLNGD